jgi:uncharacterized membrane protein
MTSTPVQPPRPNLQPSADSGLTKFVNWLVLGIARHWLALFNLAWAIYVVLPFLAPAFMAAGLVTPARLIYSLYSFTCHQLPDHSYFLFGETPVPLLPELQAGGMPADYNLFQQRKFVGNEQLGYKVAICERDIAIYSSVVVAGLIFALARKRLPALRPKYYVLFLIPIALDGGTQLFGWRESNWWLRTFTGALFGMASVWLAYPFIDDAMQDVIDSEEARQARPEMTR